MAICPLSRLQRLCNSIWQSLARFRGLCVKNILLTLEISPPVSHRKCPELGFQLFWLNSVQLSALLAPVGYGPARDP